MSEYEKEQHTSRHHDEELREADTETETPEPEPEEEPEAPLP